MRISTMQINQQGVSRMLELSRQTAEIQQQISSGKRIVKPSDDPVGAARVQKLTQEIAIRDRYQANMDSAEALLVQEETVLNQILDVLQRVRELSLQAANGVQTSEDRGYIATEISARFDELVALANTRGVEGEYLFSGYQSDVPPFSVSGNTIRYQGDEGQRRVQIDNGQTVATGDSGRSLFVDIESASPVFTTRAHPSNHPLSDGAIGNGQVVDRDALAEFFPDDLVIEFNEPSASPTNDTNFTIRRQSDNRVVEGLENVTHVPGTAIRVAGMNFNISGQPQTGDRFFVETTDKRDLLSTVRGIANGLISIDPIEDPTAFQNMLDDTLTGLDNAMGAVLEVEADLGSRLNVIDSTRRLHDDLKLHTQEVISEIRDLDFAEAVGRLSLQSFVLEAAQQSFIRISGLSLFNVLR